MSENNEKNGSNSLPESQNNGQVSANIQNVRAWFTITKEGDDDPDVTEFMVTSKGISVGRGAQADIRLSGREISRRHLHIYWNDDELLVIEDLGSSNGVYLNDTRLTPNIGAELREQDVIRAGPYIIRFERYIYGSVPSAQPRSMVPVEDGVLAPVEMDVFHLPGLPRNRSTWMNYLPGIFSEDEFMGRYLLIFESISSPLVWLIDNFDLFLSPETAPPAWLQWLSSWFDVLLLPELPEARQRQIVSQLGWLYKRRGTPVGLTRILELYFGVAPEIIENEPCHFEVVLDIRDVNQDNVMPFDIAVANRLIMSQKPAFASYDLRVIGENGSNR